MKKFESSLSTFPTTFLSKLTQVGISICLDFENVLNFEIWKELVMLIMLLRNYRSSYMMQ